MNVEGVKMKESRDQEEKAMNIVFSVGLVAMILLLAGIPAISMLFNF
jgi:hypothetical protein